MLAFGIQLLKRLWKFGDGCEFFMVDSGWGVFSSTREKIQRVDNYVTCGECRLSEIWV